MNWCVIQIHQNLQNRFFAIKTYRNSASEQVRATQFCSSSSIEQSLSPEDGKRSTLILFNKKVKYTNVKKSKKEKKNKKVKQKSKKLKKKSKK